MAATAKMSETDLHTGHAAWRLRYAFDEYTAMLRYSDPESAQCKQRIANKDFSIASAASAAASSASSSSASSAIAGSTAAASSAAGSTNFAAGTGKASSVASSASTSTSPRYGLENPDTAAS